MFDKMQVTLEDGNGRLSWNVVKELPLAAV